MTVERPASRAGQRAGTLEHRPATAGCPPLEIHRSTRRRRSATAAAHHGVIVVRLPAGLESVAEERMIADLVRKVTGRVRADALGGDAQLERRAHRLADRYLDGVRPTSVRWAGGMTRRLGSCTPSTGEIRLSRAVASYPGFVRDYVLVHELAHLHVAGHSTAFHELVARYPHTERARGWLEGYEAGQLLLADPATEESG